MTKQDDYVIHAAETMELANRAANVKDKGRLLRLAERWLDLADRAGLLTRRHGPEPRQHPLVATKLGQPDAE